MLSVEEHLDCGLVGRAGCHGHDEPGSQCLLKLLWRRHIVQMDLHLMATSQGDIVKARVHSMAKDKARQIETTSNLHLWHGNPFLLKVSSSYGGFWVEEYGGRAVWNWGTRDFNLHVHV